MLPDKRLSLLLRPRHARFNTVRLISRPCKFALRRGHRRKPSRRGLDGHVVEGEPWQGRQPWPATHTAPSLLRRAPRPRIPQESNSCEYEPAGNRRRISCAKPAFMRVGGILQARLITLLQVSLAQILGSSHYWLPFIESRFSSDAATEMRRRSGMQTASQRPALSITSSATTA